MNPRRFSPTSPVVPLAFAMTFPSLVTWMYFVALSDREAAIQQGAYSIGKFIQFAFPCFWVFVVLRRKWPQFKPSAHGLAIGVGFGVLVWVAMVLLYYLVLKPHGVLADPSVIIREKVASTGLDSSVRYFGLGCFYVVFHSLMEEYYWRWFVFRELRRIRPMPTAMIVSSLGFMAHHVILLAVYFGWDSPWTYTFSLGVAVGGAIWAWLYERCGSLIAPWVSHALVDAAIFTIGYDIVGDTLA